MAADTPDDEWRGRRADARRNHEAVMAAAREVFAEKGVEGTIPEVAARAGVGKATVYRSHPTKQALLEAVAREHLAWFDDQVQAATADPDAFAGLRRLFVGISERLASDRLVADALAAVGQRDGGRYGEPFGALVVRAQADGAMRADVSTEEVRVLIAGYARVLFEREVRDPETWRRYAGLVHDAMRAHPSV